MSSQEQQFDLSSWRGEFLDASVEEGFRTHIAESAARDLRLALWAWIALLLLLSVNDYRLFGTGGGDTILVVARLILLSGLLVLIYHSHRQPGMASSGYAVTGLEMLGFFTFFLLYFTHQGTTTLYTIVITLLMLIAIFVVIPNRVIPATAAALFGTLGTMYCAWLLSAGEGTVISLLLFLLSSCGLGYLAARRQQLTQRRQYALLQQTEEMNRKLNAEIERRTLLEEELKQQAITDPLTGLYNRRHFESLFERERKRAKRSQSEFCLCLIDLDYFKRVNDQYGHEVGDRVLQQAAALFTTGLRQTDVVGRIGGEEFVLLLPDTKIDAAGLLVERLRYTLSIERLHMEGVDIGITATFALTSVDARADTLVSALRLADKALYEGKAAGRNCVMLTARCASVSGIQRAGGS